MKVNAPKTVIRLRRVPKPMANWGYKWHLVERKKKRLTMCGILLRPSMNLHKWEGARLVDVKVRDCCAKCFGGLILSD